MPSHLPQTFLISKRLYNLESWGFRMSRFRKYVLKVVPEMLVSMNQQRAAAKTVGSRVRQTCGQTGRKGQLADMESWVKLRACLGLACLGSKWGYCLPLSVAAAISEINMQSAFRCGRRSTNITTAQRAWCFVWWLSPGNAVDKLGTHAHTCTSKMTTVHLWCFFLTTGKLASEDDKRQSRNWPPKPLSPRSPYRHLSAIC